MYSLRKFNENGIREFTNRYVAMKETENPIDLSDLLEDDNLTTIILEEKSIEMVNFSSRMECGEYFFNLFESNRAKLNSKNVDPLNDLGMWCWLTAVWSRYLQYNPDGKFNIGSSSALARWVYEPGHPRRNYRHLLAGPYRLYTLHSSDPSRIRILMFNDVRKPNTAWVEQICSRKEIINDGQMMEFIHEMFFDELQNKPRSKPKNFKQVGDVRRFGVVYNQLIVNWDMHGMPQESIKEIIPGEFDAWLAKSRKKSSVVKKIAARRRVTKK